MNFEVEYGLSRIKSKLSFVNDTLVLINFINTSQMLFTLYKGKIGKHNAYYTSFFHKRINSAKHNSFSLVCDHSNMVENMTPQEIQAYKNWIKTYDIPIEDLR